MCVFVCGGVCVYVWVLCLSVCVLVELMFSPQGIATMAKRVSELRLTLCVCLCVGGRCVCLGAVSVGVCVS